jgi:hypothetical protein
LRSEQRRCVRESGKKEKGTMSDRSWSLDWKIDDKTILLDRNSGTLAISVGFANRFSIIYGDPRKMAEILREIADTLLQCEHIGLDANNNPVQCNTPGTVRREYKRSGNGYMPAFTVCDDHFAPIAKATVARQDGDPQQRSESEQQAVSS